MLSGQARVSDFTLFATGRQEFRSTTICSLRGKPVGKLLFVSKVAAAAELPAAASVLGLQDWDQHDFGVNAPTLPAYVGGREPGSPVNLPGYCGRVGSVAEWAPNGQA